MQKIEECDGLIALAAPRDALASGKFTAPQWVLDELAHARAKGKPTLAIVLKNVEMNGLSTQHERADLDPADAVPALVIARRFKRSASLVAFTMPTRARASVRFRARDKPTRAAHSRRSVDFAHR